MELQLTELLTTDFDGCRFKEVSKNVYSIADGGNTLELEMVDGRWQIWIDLSLCLESDLPECIEWINEYLS